MRLSIVRHADPDYVADALTERGHREAAALADELGRRGVDRLFSSPLGRARATAAAVAAKLGIEPLIEPWTRELSGVEVRHDDGRAYHHWDVDGACLRADDAFSRHDPAAWPAPLDRDLIAGGVRGIASGSDDFCARLGYQRDAGLLG